MRVEGLPTKEELVFKCFGPACFYEFEIGSFTRTVKFISDHGVSEMG